MALPLDTQPHSFTITHPSGLRATFTVKAIRHGRSYMPNTCDQSDPSDSRVRMPIWYDTVSLTAKQVTNNGVTQIWNYSYSDPHASFAANCETSTSCTTTVTSTATAPDSTRTVYLYKNKWGQDEGKLMRSDTYEAGGSAALRSELYRYAAANAGPYPAKIGSSMQSNVNEGQLGYLMPQDRRQIVDGSDTYTTTTTAFSSYGDARTVAESNDISSENSRTTTTERLYDRARWVLGLPTTVTDSSGAVPERYEYETSSRPVVLKAQYVFGYLQRSYTWNANGTLASVVDPLQRSTLLQNYRFGIPQKVIYPDSDTDSGNNPYKSIVVGAFPQIDSITDEAGAKTGYEYTSVGRLKTIIYPTSDSVDWLDATLGYTQLTAVENGQPVGSWRVRRAEGRRRSSTYYDGMFRPVLTEDMDTATGVVSYVESRYDAEGRLVFQSYPATTSSPTAGINYSYDAIGRPTGSATTDGVSIETIVYESGGSRGTQKLVTDANNHQTRIAYQAFGEPSYELPVYITTAGLQDTTIERDVFGNLLSVTQSGTNSPSVTRLYVYDGRKRVCKIVEPESGQTVFSYDVANQVVWEAHGQSGSITACDQGAVPTSSRITHTYYARGWPWTIDYPDATGDISYTYDKTGRVKTAVNPKATWTYGYNKRGLLETETATVDDRTFAFTHSYDVIGVEASFGWPGRTVSYSPDAWGRPKAIGSITDIAWHPNGILKSYRLGSTGLAYSATLNDRQWPRELKVTGPTTQMSLVHNYDAKGNVTAIGDNTSQDDRSIAYDALDRLQTVTATSGGSWGDYGYTYNALNDIKTATHDGTATYNYDATTRRLLSVTGAVQRSYGYNARGEITADGLYTYARNMASQITEVGGVGNYAYDANGKRIKTYVAGKLVYWLYGQDGTLYDRFDPATNTHIDYEQLGGKTVADVKVAGGNQTITYLNNDLLGSPVSATSNTGALLWQQHYGPWGEHLLTGGGDPIGYTGHVDDYETGLTYMQARFYDPQVGRFLSVDPVGFDGSASSFTRYAYANNNPYRYTDPTGMASFDCSSGSSSCPSQMKVADLQKGDVIKTDGASITVGDKGSVSLSFSAGYANGSSAAKTGPTIVPVGPKTADVDKNIDAAKGKSPIWFRDQVKNKGPWDYKQQGKIDGADYEAFGNFNYGAAGRSIFPTGILLQEAGRAQQAAGTSMPEWGNPGIRLLPFTGSGSFGDDPVDQFWIQQGSNYYDNH